jgi:isoquinoline 1-oxidoreductase subunit beta
MRLRDGCEVTLKRGRAEESNFNGHRVLRMNDMRKVEVYGVDFAEPPWGIGDATMSPIGQAVSNAFAAGESGCAHCHCTPV